MGDKVNEKLSRFWSRIGRNLDIIMFFVSLFVLIGLSIISNTSLGLLFVSSHNILNGTLLLFATVLIYIFYLIKIKPDEDKDSETSHHHFNKGMKEILEDKNSESISNIDIFCLTSLQFHTMLFNDGVSRKIKHVRLLLPNKASIESYLKQLSDKTNMDYQDILNSFKSEFDVVVSRWRETVGNKDVETFEVKETSVFPFLYFCTINNKSILYGFYKDKSGTHGVDTDKVFIDRTGVKTNFIKACGERFVFDQLWNSATAHSIFKI